MAVANLTWTPAVGELLNQVVRYRVLGDLVWIEAATVGPAVNNYQITGLLSNVIYEFNIQSVCGGLGAVNSLPDTAVFLTCPVITMTPGASSLTFSFDHLGGDVDSYDIVLTTSLDVPVPGTAETISSPSGNISRTYTSLPPAETYKFKLTVNAGEFSLECEETGQPYDCTLTGEVICEMTYTTECVDCAPTMAIVDNNLARLDVGVVTSPSCTVGNYVIDWYLDSIAGPIEFTSGVGSDPAITEFHPFQGTQARPVVAGEWIPVIRYIDLDGFRYYSTYTPGQRYSPDLRTCLPSVTVENYNCGNGNLTPPANELSGYTHEITYTNTVQVAADSSRTVRMDLNTDGSTNYFVWEFNGFQIADRFQLFYVSSVTETLLEDHVIGDDNSTNIYTTLPYRSDFTGAIRKMTDISAIPYVLGDWLKIVVTPSYNNPANTNTNWTFRFRCLETFDCTICPEDYLSPDLSGVTMTYNAVSCRYEIYIPLLNNCNRTNLQMWNYNFTSNASTIQAGSSGQYQLQTSGTPNVKYMFRKNQTCGYVFSPLNNSTCVAASGNITLNKTSNVVTITCANNTDYLAYKNSYNTAMANANMVTYSPDQTNINHYKFLVLYLRSAPTCGDTQTVYDLSFHYTSSVVFDDTNRIMTITMTNTSNGFISGCGDCSTVIPQYIVNTTADIAIADFNLNSSVRATTPFGAVVATTTINDDTMIAAHAYDIWGYATALYPCSPIPSYLCNLAFIPANNFYRLYNYYYAIRATITNNADPLNNYRLESYLDNTTKCINYGTFTTIYEVENGIRII